MSALASMALLTAQPAARPGPRARGQFARPGLVLLQTFASRAQAAQDASAAQV